MNAAPGILRGVALGLAAIVLIAAPFGLKTYGMFVADNGKGWFLSGAPDPRWSDNELGLLKLVHGRDFEVVRMGTIVTK